IQGDARAFLRVSQPVAVGVSGACGRAGHQRSCLNREYGDAQSHSEGGHRDQPPSSAWCRVLAVPHRLHPVYFVALTIRTESAPQIAPPPDTWPCKNAWVAPVVSCSPCVEMTTARSMRPSLLRSTKVVRGLPFFPSQTCAPARVIVAGSSFVASKVTVLKIATGTGTIGTPLESTKTGFGYSPGSMSIWANS